MPGFDLKAGCKSIEQAETMTADKEAQTVVAKLNALADPILSRILIDSGSLKLRNDRLKSLA